MNILIVRVSSFGDRVHNMQILADIRCHFSDANIARAVVEAYTSLVRLNTHVGDVIPFALRRWHKSLFFLATWPITAVSYHGEVTD